MFQPSQLRHPVGDFPHQIDGDLDAGHARQVIGEKRQISSGSHDLGNFAEEEAAAEAYRETARAREEGRLGELLEEMKQKRAERVCE